jgi:hypothetical protein
MSTSADDVRDASAIATRDDDVRPSEMALRPTSMVYRARLGGLPSRIDQPRHARPAEHRAEVSRPGPSTPTQSGTTSSVGTAPALIARTISVATGVDVGSVRVHRGSAVATAARSIGAKAFSYDEQVFLPDELGGLDDPEARALLAHELTHVAQQRLFGAVLPAEGSPDGQLLEAQAIEVERLVRDGAPLPPMTHLRLGAGSISAASFASSGGATVARAASVQRAGEDILASWSADGFEAPSSEVPEEGAVIDSVGELFARSAMVVAPRADVSDVVRTATVAAETPAPTAEQRLVDLDDTDAIDELAVRIYGSLRGRLQSELLVDRERSGSLMDFR